MLDLAVTSWMTPKAQEKQRNWTSSKSNTCPPRTTQSEKVYPQSEGKHFQVINLVRIIPRKYTELLQLNNNRTQLKNKGLEQTLLHRRYTNGVWADKKMLKVTSHREMQVRPPIRYYFIHIRMTSIKKKFWKRCAEIATLVL